MEFKRVAPYLSWKPSISVPTIRDSTPNAALFADGVHVNAAGYDLLGAAIRETVTAILAAGAPAAR
ncbi:MAG: hypothetical protein FJ221_14740 [Lentisphaerae bacterium]|nr:hypothetical protein [Lentisphaerota bacterium]